MAYERKYTYLGVDYFYNIPNLKISSDHKRYLGVATIHYGENESFTVPFYVKYDEIDLTINKINEGIEKYLTK